MNNTSTPEHTMVTAAKNNSEAARSRLTFDATKVIYTKDKHYAYLSREDSIRIMEANPIFAVRYPGERAEYLLPDGEKYARRILIDRKEMRVAVSAFGNINSGYCFYNS